jgi:hypothetical protein
VSGGAPGRTHREFPVSHRVVGYELKSLGHAVGFPARPDGRASHVPVRDFRFPFRFSIGGVFMSTKTTAPAAKQGAPANDPDPRCFIPDAPLNIPPQKPTPPRTAFPDMSAEDHAAFAGAPPGMTLEDLRQRDGGAHGTLCPRCNSIHHGAPSGPNCVIGDAEAHLFETAAAEGRTIHCTGPSGCGGVHPWPPCQK